MRARRAQTRAAPAGWRPSDLPRGRPASLEGARLVDGLTRVGLRHADRLRWILDFADRELNSAEVLEEVRWELLALITVPASSRPGQRLRKDLSEVTIMHNAESRGASLAQGDARRVVRRMQADAKKMLTDLRTNRCFDPRVSVREVYWDNEGIGPEPTGDERERFRGAVLGLLMRCGRSLRLCPRASCGRLLVANGRRRYCTAACANRERGARFKQNNPERSQRLRQASYERMREKRMNDAIPSPGKSRRRYGRVPR
jgi:hypothetical protein